MNLFNKRILNIELFNGYSSLMRNIWNAPNRLTRVLNINTLVNDYNHQIRLSNGFLLKINSIGVLSLDILGKADISLWSQYANMLVKTK